MASSLRRSRVRLPRAEEHGNIFCIEKDHVLIEELITFASQENSAVHNGGDPRINIIEGDALKLLLEVIEKNHARRGGGAL